MKRAWGRAYVWVLPLFARRCTRATGGAVGQQPEPGGTDSIAADPHRADREAGGGTGVGRQSPAGSHTHTWNSIAYYVQAGYRLPLAERLWKSYYGFEYIHIPRTDAVFTGVPSPAGSVRGVRYDISAFAAIKAEYRNTRRPGLRRIKGAFLQTSFTF